MLSNNPPEGDALTLRLDEFHANLKERADELLAAVERVPATLDETTHDKAAAFVKQMKLHVKKIGDSRVAEKEPFLAGGRAVDGWFGKLSDPLTAACRQVEQRIAAFLKAKAEAERRVREEEARKAAEEAAARLAAMVDEGDLTTAIVAEETAARAAKAAVAPVADLARTRTAYGTTSSLRTELAFEVTNKAEAVRAIAALLDDEAVAKAIRAWLRLNKAAAEHIIAGKADPLPGIRLFHDQIARVA